ncbi:MAG: bifunctional precorrin-2 dehydrogenase/sirohydrochlorin ferrochelatase, partial [Methanomicrobiales archaeon]|nr:bifunctional precorrin-2 dehydrogenase/sirohydrochlorin ferrochelatase [Methanomicrobiales archaeon]
DLSAMAKDELQALLRGSFLVVAATSEQTLNDRIGATCQEMGILCNNADGAIGDVIIPATTGGKAYCVAVTTFGKSPAFARYLRTYLEREGREFDRMISLQERARLSLKDQEFPVERRGSVLWEIINDPEVWEHLKGDEESAWTLVQQRYLHG